MANETTQTHESTGADGNASGGGLPQFQFVWWPGQVVWLLLIFVVLYVLLSKLFLPRVGGTILIDLREVHLQDLAPEGAQVPAQGLQVEAVPLRGGDRGDQPDRVGGNALRCLDMVPVHPNDTVDVEAVRRRMESCSRLLADAGKRDAAAACACRDACAARSDRKRACGQRRGRCHNSLEFTVSSIYARYSF